MPSSPSTLAYSCGSITTAPVPCGTHRQVRPINLPAQHVDQIGILEQQLRWSFPPGDAQFLVKVAHGDDRQYLAARAPHTRKNTPPSISPRPSGSPRNTQHATRIAPPTSPHLTLEKRKRFVVF